MADEVENGLGQDQARDLWAEFNHRLDGLEISTRAIIYGRIVPTRRQRWLGHICHLRRRHSVKTMLSCEENFLYEWRCRICDWTCGWA